jgi:hypothetical protein
MAATPSARAAATPAALRAPRLEKAIALLAGLSWVAALIHAAAIPEHWHEYRPYAVCFAVLALAQAGWAAAFFRAPSRGLLLAAVVLSGGVIAVWIASRTVGLPVGPEPWTPEPAGVPDVAATDIELVLAAAGLQLLRCWPRIPAWLLPIGTTVLVAGGVALAAGGHAH